MRPTQTSVGKPSDSEGEPAEKGVYLEKSTGLHVSIYICRKGRGQRIRLDGGEAHEAIGAVQLGGDVPCSALKRSSSRLG